MKALVVPVLLAQVSSGARWAAVVFDIEPGWHIYWENPGDTGIPTEVVLRAAEGTEIGPARFAGPDRIPLPGGLVSFGFHDRTAVLFELGPGDPAAALQADASWLVCRDDLCLPGSATVSRSGDLDEATLAPLLTALPQPPPDGAVERHGDTVIISLPGAPPAEFFPERTLEPGLRGVDVRKDGDGVRCTLGLAPDASGRAVISVAGDSSRRYTQITIPERPR